MVSCVDDENWLILSCVYDKIRVKSMWYPCILAGKGDEMDHNVLKRVILEQTELIKKVPICGRDYSFEMNVNYLLVGLRRAGKSTLLYKMARDLVEAGCGWSQIIFVNFEDDRILDFKRTDFDDILEVAYELAGDKEAHFFFDEIQIVEGWEHFARRMADQKKHVCITGSNAKMLSSEMESVLGGRYISKMIMPFSFSEILSFKSVEHGENALLTASGTGAIIRACQEYVAEGGLPEMLSMVNKREYIKSVFEKVLLGDILEREKIKNQMALRLMVKKIAETVMHEVSFNTLAGNVKAAGVRTSTDSMLEYASYAENAYLLFRTRNFVSKFAEKESLPRFYFYDTGILSLFLVDKAPALLENTVAVHLRRRFGNDVYYYKSRQTGIDVDFYIPEAKCAVQAAYSLEGTEKRELGSLLSLAEKDAGVRKLIVVTNGEEKVISRKGFEIEVMPIHKFLLQF